MEHKKCRLLDSNNVIAEDIDVLINESSPTSILKSWKGEFELPFTANLELGMSFRLMLEDGRSGEILIKKIRLKSQSNKKSIEFIGTGPLK